MNASKDLETQIQVFMKNFGDYGTPLCNQQLLTRTFESLWKSATVLDTSATPPQIEIGRNALSETEKWALQAAVRRDAKGGREYNKRVQLQQKVPKAPDTVPGDRGFSPGRGRPKKE